MKQITLRSQSPPTKLVESDTQNALTTNPSVDWTDFAGLSWIFLDHSFEDYT
ncbi:hypothetical protein [Nitrosopumilus oxyclinae]|uniref:hypothetical protein n=1 Tax=Nitrosopumilus oxyclinae TaxID=1959104 RepID=UPI0015CAF1FD|nr:hypothetical protein [Nitrosopumilus oxyclinae]